jgi:hypothetical protein
MPTYMGDMMHCRQGKCIKRDKCYRFWLGQHATGLVTMFHPKEPIINGCENFLNVKNY